MKWNKEGCLWMCFMDITKRFMVLGLHYLFYMTAGYSCGLGYFPLHHFPFRMLLFLSYSNQFGSHLQTLVNIIVTWLVFLILRLSPTTSRLNYSSWLSRPSTIQHQPSVWIVLLARAWFAHSALCRLVSLKLICAFKTCLCGMPYLLNPCN